MVYSKILTFQPYINTCINITEYSKYYDHSKSGFCMKGVASQWGKGVQIASGISLNYTLFISLLK